MIAVTIELYRFGNNSLIKMNEFTHAIQNTPIINIANQFIKRLGLNIIISWTTTSPVDPIKIWLHLPNPSPFKIMIINPLRAYPTKSMLPNNPKENFEKHSASYLSIQL